MLTIKMHVFFVIQTISGLRNWTPESRMQVNAFDQLSYRPFANDKYLVRRIDKL